MHTLRFAAGKVFCNLSPYIRRSGCQEDYIAKALQDYSMQFEQLCFEKAAINQTLQQLYLLLNAIKREGLLPYYKARFCRFLYYMQQQEVPLITEGYLSLLAFSLGQSVERKRLSQDSCLQLEAIWAYLAFVTQSKTLLKQTKAQKSRLLASEDQADASWEYLLQLVYAKIAGISFKIRASHKPCDRFVALLVQEVEALAFPLLKSIRLGLDLGSQVFRQL